MFGSFRYSQNRKQVIDIDSTLKFSTSSNLNSNHKMGLERCAS